MKEPCWVKQEMLPVPVQREYFLIRDENLEDIAETQEKNNNRKIVRFETIFKKKQTKTITTEQSITFFEHL